MLIEDISLVLILAEREVGENMRHRKIFHSDQ